MSNLTYFNSSFDTSNNHYHISSSFGYVNLNLGIPDCFVWNNLVQVNNSNIYVDLSFGDSNSRYNTRINRSNIELRYNNSNILTSNYVMPLNTSNEITLKYSIDTLGLFVNRSNLLNITYSNTDFDDGYYQVASSNQLGLSNQVGGITNLKFPRVNGIFTFRTPVEFQGNVRVNGNVISSNIIQLSNLVFTQCNTSSNLFNLSSIVINTSNHLTNRINFNSNNLIRRTGDVVGGEYTFSNTHPFGLNSTLTLTANVSQNMSAEYIGEGFIKSITSNVERNVLSVIHNSNQVIRIVNDGRIVASNITSCNLNALSNQSSFSSNTAVWSSNNIGSINFGSNNSVFSSNTSVWSSNNLLNRNTGGFINGNTSIFGTLGVNNKIDIVHSQTSNWWENGICFLPQDGIISGNSLGLIQFPDDGRERNSSNPTGGWALGRGNTYGERRITLRLPEYSAYSNAGNIPRFDVITTEGSNIMSVNTNRVVDINALVSASNVQVKRGTRITFNTLNDSNHLLYMNNDNLDGEGGFSGIKWNVNNGLWIRTGTANLGSNNSNQVIPPQTAVFITSNRVGISKSNPTRELDVNGNIICSNILCSNINTSNIVCSNITGNNIYFNEIFEGGVALSNKYLTLSSSNSSNFTLGTTAPINNIYITEENGGGGGFGSLLLAGLVSAGVSAVVGFGMNGIKVAAGGVERSLADWGTWGVERLQNGLSRVVNDMQNRFLKGYTKMISDGGREWLNITGGPPTGLGAGIGPYTEKIALLGDSFKAGLFSVSIDGDSNTITITNFNSNTSNITSNVVICDNNSFFMSNVAIGKSNPTSMLDVNGTITASGLSAPIITTLSNQIYSFSNISSNVFNLSNQLNEFNWSNTKLINSNTQFVLSGSAIQESNWVRLTEFLPNQTGTILYSNISQSNDFRVSFDMFGARPSNITNGADGVYVNFFSSNTAFQGTGYTLFFDNFNGGVGQNDALRILWNNSTIFNSNLGLSNYWDSSNWVNVNISLSNQSFNVNVNSNQRVFNFTDTIPRNKGDINNFYINGRTGGFCNIHRIKDVQFDTIKDWRWYNDINNNLIINNSNILNNRLNTTSNSLVSVSNYLYNIIDPEATFASNIGVYSSNTIINTSNLLSNRITGLSNIIINNSNAIHPQATFSSNLAVYSSNAINSLNSNSSIFSSNVAVYSSNNMISRIGENQFIVPNSSNTFADTFLQIKHGGLNDGSPNWLKLGVIGSAFNGIATIDTASGGIAAWTPLSFRIQNLEAMQINTNRTITLNSNLTACNVSALNITGISNIAVWSSNNISAITFGSNNSVFSSNTATWSSNNLMLKNGGNLLRFDNSIQNRKIVLYDDFNNDHQYYGMGINGGTLRFQVGDTTNAFRFFSGINSSSSREAFIINGNGNINSYGNINVNNTNTNTSRIEIQARGEGASNTAELLFGTSFNNSSNNGLKGGLIFQGLNGWSRGNLHFCMEDTQASLANNNATLSNSRMILSSSGNLGVGTGTSIPTERLDLNGSMLIRNGNGGNGFGNNQLMLGWNNTTLYKHCIKSRHHEGSESSTFGNAIDMFLWQTGQGTNDPGNRHIMSLTALGVGIGTSNPTSLQGSLLHIRTSNNLANTLNLQNQGGAGARAGVSFQTNSSTWYFNNDGNNQVLYGGTGFIGMITNSNFQIMDQNAGNDVRFFVNASNANVGINVFNPTGQIHMNNRVMNRKIVMWDGTGNDHEFYGFGISSFEQQYRVPDGAVHRFVSSTSSTSSKNLLTISSAGWSRFEGDLECSFFAVGGDATNRSIEVYDDLTRKTSTSTWQISSDERVKTNIKDADYDICYNNFKKIKLKSFSYNSNIKPFDKVKDKNTLGYIAQDVYKVFPKAVSIDESRFGFSNFMSLDTDIINKCMYGCIHKLIEKVEELEEEVKELKKNKKDNKW